MHAAAHRASTLTGKHLYCLRIFFTLFLEFYIKDSDFLQCGFAHTVTDLNIYLSARNTFSSGKSDKQLRILGDVIAREAVWERTPLLEENPTEFNKPSEYLIEDFRKYVIPPPGDAELPDDRNVWRQVNPSTGQVLDSY